MRITVFPVNDFKVFLITRCFILDVKVFLDSLLQAIHQTCISSHLITLNVFKYKISRFLKFWCKLNTRRISKTCPFRFCMIKIMIPSMLSSPNFLTISYRFHDVFTCFPQRFYDFLGCFYYFPSVFPPFPILDFALFFLCVCMFYFVFAFLLWELLQGSSRTLGDKQE